MQGSREGTGTTQEREVETGTVGGGEAAGEEMIAFTFIRKAIQTPPLKPIDIHLSNCFWLRRLIIIGVRGS